MGLEDIFYPLCLLVEFFKARSKAEYNLAEHGVLVYSTYHTRVGRVVSVISHNEQLTLGHRYLVVFSESDVCYYRVENIRREERIVIARIVRGNADVVVGVDVRLIEKNSVYVYRVSRTR